MLRVLHSSFFKSIVVIFCLLGLVHSAFAATVVMPSDDDMIIGARAIVRGRVLSMGAALDKDEIIYTYITLRVDEVLKGEITGREIVIKQEGGQVGERGHILYGAPDFTVDEDVLLYLDTRRDGSLRVHQMALGKFSIVGDPNTGHQFAVRSGFDDGVVSLPAHSHSNQTSATVTNRMEMNAYMDMVRVRLAANQEASNVFLDTHYRDVPIFERPAEYDSELSRGGIQPAFTTISPANPRWFEPLSGQPVVFDVNPNNAPNAQINSDITAAMNAWSTVPGNPLVVQVGPNTGACGPSSSQNTIIFNGCDGRWSPSPTCQGTLAVGGLSWTSQSIVVGGVTYRRATRGFVSFNPNASCFFTNPCNVREVMTHELGHALGLGHSQFGVATMFASAHFDGRCASIRQDDVDGINFLYVGPGGGGGGPLTITTSSPLTGGSQGTFYSQTLAASGGQSPYTWNLLSGSLPTGLGLSSGGVISGTPSVTGTFSFTVQVTDDAAATAQKAFSLTISPPAQPDSQFVLGIVPQSVQPGQSFNVTLRWLNTGTESWTGSAGFSLRSQNPPNNLTWGGNTVSLNSVFISPGQQLNITFTAFAPQAPGAYNFQWQLWKDGLGFFGEPSLNVSIQVGSNCTFTIDPTSQNFPASGGAANLSVNTQSGCNWTATSNAPWINITSGASGTGNGLVSYSVSANSNPVSRTGTMTVAGQTFTVT
ncbi:MAG: putative Ig domain-containing protein, partial [Blastocatellia bacterium]|nr:putative Ig domain-containing protein [Blastocatellia bacterium]